MAVIIPEGANVTLPASWYSSPSLYDLERRAVFGKSWLLVTHRLRFSGPGSYVNYTIAGYPFFIIQDRQRELNAFLNVCRHRAFPVVLEPEGRANILPCKYHGWSYGLKGNLTKAPGFDDKVEGFAKADHGLYRVHLHIDKLDFVYVNFDSAAEPSIPWNQQFVNVDVQSRLDVFDIAEYKYDHSFSIPGAYNWKTLMDNYNECYHCKVAHPILAAITNLKAHEVRTENGTIQHHVEPKGGIKDVRNDSLAPTYLWPNAATTISRHYFYLMRVVPVSATTVSMEYEVYRSKLPETTDAIFNSSYDWFKQIEEEDIQLCERAQTNLNSGGYVAGPLHPHHEEGVMHFQSLVKEALVKHREEEERAGKEIRPAQRMPMRTGLEEEDLFCRSLCTMSTSVVVNGAKNGIAW